MWKHFDATAVSGTARRARPAGHARPARPARPARRARPVNLLRGLAALLAGLLLAGMAVLAGWWSSRPLKPYRLPPPVGHRTLRDPLAIELVIDQSGSNRSSDPHGLRISESAEVLRWLGKYARPSDVVGVVQFSNSAVTTLPLTTVRRAAARAGSATNPDARVAGGGTNIPGALAAGVENLTHTPKKSRKLLLLFTDGASDTQGAIAPVLTNANGIQTFLVALDADGTYDQSSRFWESLGLAGITRIKNASRGAVARPIAEAVLKETGQRLPH